MNPNSILLYDLTESLYERWAHLIEFADSIRAGNSGFRADASSPQAVSPLTGFNPGRVAHSRDGERANNGSPIDQ